jgi:hypothetical protein
VQPQDEVEDGGFATPRRADQGRHTARLGRERQVADGLLVCSVREGDVAELQARRADLQWRPILIGRFGRRAVDHLEQDSHADQ